MFLNFICFTNFKLNTKLYLLWIHRFNEIKLNIKLKINNKKMFFIDQALKNQF